MVLVPFNIKRAYNRRVRCSCIDKQKYYPIFKTTPKNYAEVSIDYTFTLEYGHEIPQWITNVEVLQRPTWLNITSTNSATQTVVFTGTPTTIGNTDTLQIKLIDFHGNELIKSFTIKTYFKVFNVIVSNEAVTPGLNYYILTDFDDNLVNLGTVMTYQSGVNAIYRFNQAHVSNKNHPLRLSDQNGIVNTLSSDITVVGTAGEAGSYVDFVSNNANNYIYCLYHGFGMGAFYQPSSSYFTTTIDSNKFVVNGNPSYSFSGANALQYGGAYLFNISNNTVAGKQLLFKKTDDRNGADYETYYSYGVPGADGLVALVIKNNLPFTIQEANADDYGDNYNGNIVINSNNNTGTVAITGVFKQNEILTASATDADGVPAESAITYQWLRNGVAITGANSKTYTIVSSDYGKTINVNVQYKDNAGYYENNTSSNVNNVVDSQGTVTLSGTYEVNKAITANLTDPDGIQTISSYQWIRSNTSNMASPTNIGTGTNTYTPVPGDLSKYISVKLHIQIVRVM